jgi:NDP-sugar pyrophosphorylase family protein
MKAVVLAAGEGTRLRPLTFLSPKPMIPLGPEPAIHYLLSQLSREGFDEIVMVLGYMGNQIMDYLGDGSKLGLRISYALKPEEFRCGTAGSLRLAEHLLGDAFLVAQADTLSEIPLREAMRFHRQKGAQATIVLTTVENPGEFGVTILDDNDNITEFQEKPGHELARSNLVSTGFYILEPETLDHIGEAKWDFAKDLFPHLLEMHDKMCGFVSNDFWVDIGSLEGYLRGVKWILEKTVTEAPQTQNGGGKVDTIVINRPASTGAHPGLAIMSSSKGAQLLREVQRLENIALSRAALRSSAKAFLTEALFWKGPPLARTARSFIA